MEKIYINGKIYIGKKDNVWEETVVTSNDKIVFVGDLEKAKEEFPRAVEIDLKGKCLFPGFIDAHAHPIMAAYYSSGIQFDIMMEKESIFAQVEKFLKENPDRDNYFGHGYGEWHFNDIPPTKEILDEICNDKPILLIGSTGHEGFCNSKTLELAGITKDTKDPIPGFHFFYRDENGEPTGHFAELSCMLMMMDKIEFFDEEQLKVWLKVCFDMYREAGITAVAECGAEGFMEEKGLPLLHSMIETGEVPQRIFGSELILTQEAMIGSIERLLEKRTNIYIQDMLEFKTMKIINDGTFETKTASLVEPYTYNGEKVEPMLCDEQLSEFCLDVAKENLDIYIHAIGDKAIHETVKAAKAVREAGYDKTRITNAHTTLCIPEDIPLFAKYNIIANTTGCWHYGTDNDRPIIGDRTDRTYPIKEILKNGGKLSLGSDFPVDELGIHPMISMEVAHTRQMPGEPDALVLPPVDWKLSIEEIIGGYTIGAAYQIGMEDKIGSIEVGKYADFSVFDNNPFEVDKYEIHNIKTAMTVINGEIVYSNI